MRSGGRRSGHSRSPGAGRSRRCYRLRGSRVPRRRGRCPAPTMAIPGDASTVCTNSRDVAELSMSTTMTPRPRTTAGAEGEAEHDERDHRHAEQQEAHHRVAPDPAHLPRRRRQPAPAQRRSRAKLRPVGVDAHPGPQSVHRLCRIGADLERPQVEIAARARRAPAGVFALGADHAHLEIDHAVCSAGTRTSNLVPP